MLIHFGIQTLPRLIPVALDILRELPILLAVPKKRVTNRVKRIRHATQFLKPSQHIHNCAVCGSPKFLHHICTNCVKAAVIGKITEIGDLLKGVPEDPLKFKIRKIFKARGAKNTIEYFKYREAFIKDK